MNQAARHFRLAFIVSMFFEFGGMQRTLLRVARECAGRGHNVHIFTGEWRGARPDDISVHEVDTRAITNHASNRKLAAYVNTLGASSDYDCIAGFTKLPGLDVYYAGDPCFAARMHEEINPVLRLLPRYREMKHLEESVFRASASTEILLINHGERERFIRYYGTSEERFHLMPPGIARDRMASPDSATIRAGFRLEFDLAESEILLLFIGSNFVLKGLDRVLEAVSSLSPALQKRVRLFVVGTDNPAPFEKLAAGLGLGKQFHVYAARSDIRRFLAGADLLVHPAKMENTGTVILEAMVAGLPVLVTEACGYSYHVIDADAGCVIPEPFLQREMNRQLEMMLTSEQRPAWSGNGIEYGNSQDLYSLIEKAADIIIERAQMNRQQT